MIPTSANSLQLPPWLLIAGGAAIGWLRNFWNWLYRHTLGQVAKRLMVSVEIEEFDHAEAYLWAQAWVEQKLSARRISALQLRRSRKSSPCPEATVDESTSEEESRYELVPAYGFYPFFWRRRYLITFASKKEDAQPSGNTSSWGPPRRSVVLAVWGTRDRNLLLGLLSEAQRLWEARHPATLQYYFHRSSWWRSKPLPERKANTVYLPPGVMEDILADARSFLGRRAAFESMGIPWRHGILLYGPPGGGKTTLVQCMATELRLPLYYLSLSSLNSRGDLVELLDGVAQGSILLIEDVDCIAVAAERMSSGGDDTKVSMPRKDEISPSDLLNFIDGIIASQGRLLVMTTNYPEKLDRALVRAGRIDRRWKIDYASPEQLAAFHQAARANGLTTERFEEFRAALPSPCTIADAQAALLTVSAEVEP